jgi:pilus assembly protein CpaF
LVTTRPLASGGANTRHPDYQALKGRVHQELLNRLNLDRLGKTKREEAEPELRALILGMLEGEQRTTPLSLTEREGLIVEILHELFGLGPLEALLADPSISDILVNRFNQVYIEREGRLESTDIVFRDAASTSRAPWWMPV